jgi:Na+-driven multidrug efflux pump
VKKNDDSPLKFYAKYSSLALQMIVIIVGAAFGGKEIDKIVDIGFPVFTVGLTIISVVAAVIYGMREIFKQK